MEKDATVTEYVSRPTHTISSSFTLFCVFFLKFLPFFVNFLFFFYPHRPHFDLFTFVVQIIRGLLKYWPKTCTQKEVRQRPAAAPCGVHLWLQHTFFCVCGSGDVPGGDRGDSGRDRAVSVHPHPGAPLQTDRRLYFQPPLPGDEATQKENKTLSDTELNDEFECGF